MGRHCFRAPERSQRTGPPTRPLKRKGKIPVVLSSHLKLAPKPATKPQATTPDPRTRLLSAAMPIPATSTALSKTDKQSAALQLWQRRLVVNEAKLEACYNDPKIPDPGSNPKVMKLNRLQAKIKKQLSALNLKRYQTRQRNG